METGPGQNGKGKCKGSVGQETVMHEHCGGIARGPRLKAKQGREERNGMIGQESVYACN